MGLGGAQGAIECALKYAHELEQFGKPIGAFQVIAFKLADMATEIEMARLLLYKATWLCENGRPFSKEAAMAKMFCSEMYHRWPTTRSDSWGRLMKDTPLNATIETETIDIT
jgi:alkylation response protein AidB-like acyl-CoA dehydrogenase